MNAKDFINKLGKPYMFVVRTVEDGVHNSYWVRARSSAEAESRFHKWHPDIEVREVDPPRALPKQIHVEAQAKDFRQEARAACRQSGKQVYRHKPGDACWFEYRCWESPSSSDAALWYRSHQRVRVGRMIERGCGRDETERGVNGQPAVFKITFSDGKVFDATEDELLDSRKEFNRPAPPKPPVGESRLEEGDTKKRTEAKEFIMNMGSPDNRLRQDLRKHGFKVVKQRQNDDEEIWRLERGGVVHTVRQAEAGGGWHYSRNTLPDYNFMTGPENMMRDLPRYILPRHTRHEAKEFIKGVARAQLVHNNHQNYDYSVQSIYGWMTLKLYKDDATQASVIGAESQRVDLFIPLAVELLRKELPQLKTLDFNDRVVDWQNWFERAGYRLRHKDMGGGYFHWYFVDIRN